MLLLIYFNPIIGPDLLYSEPENLAKVISEETLDQIKRLMDAATPGFFTHAFSAELNTANYFFMLPSAWARGKQEMVMISKIIEEDAPSLSEYEKTFKNFVKTLKTERSTVFKALYIHNPPLNYKEEIDQEFAYIKEKLTELSKAFEITLAHTHGILMSFESIRRHQNLTLPSKILKDLESFLDRKDRVFIVFQKRKDNFKIDLIPYKKDMIIKIVVIFEGQLGPDTLKDIGEVFQDLDLPFLYTSGICQQGGDCIYEVYLNPLEHTNFDVMQEQLGRIRNVKEIKIIEIDVEDQ